MLIVKNLFYIIRFDSIFCFFFFFIFYFCFVLFWIPINPIIFYYCFLHSIRVYPSLCVFSSVRFAIFIIFRFVAFKFASTTYFFTLWVAKNNNKNRLLILNYWKRNDRERTKEESIICKFCLFGLFVCLFVCFWSDLSIDLIRFVSDLFVYLFCWDLLKNRKIEIEKKRDLSKLSLYIYFFITFLDSILLIIPY